MDIAQIIDKDMERSILAAARVIEDAEALIIYAITQELAMIWLVNSVVGLMIATAWRVWSVV